MEPRDTMRRVLDQAGDEIQSVQHCRSTTLASRFRTARFAAFQDLQGQYGCHPVEAPGTETRLGSSTLTACDNDAGSVDDPEPTPRTLSALRLLIVHRHGDLGMTARVYPAPNQTQSGGSANDPAHRLGENIDRVDRLSSLVLMGLALAGGALAINILMLVG